jgi:diketogulonate reductase-like aldo/keto reductase
LYSVTLNNKKEMPILGLGTWRLSGGETTKVVKMALQIGYNHIDTAEMYGNEKEIGDALKDFDRSKIFITSKVWYENLHYQDLISSCQTSLKKLGTDYLDLYLIHWPNPAIDMKESFQALSKLYKEEKVKAIGVSNFTIKNLKKALQICQSLSLPLSINQVEFHPFLYQESLLNFCRENNIYLTAYRPIAKGLVNNDPIIRNIAEKYQKTPAQITLKWLSQQDIITIPKASSERHLRENINIFDFELEKSDIEKLKEVNQNKRMVYKDIANFDDEFFK